MSPRGPLPWDSVLSSSDILIFLLTCSVSLSSSLCFLDATDAVPLAATKPVTLDLVDADLFLLLCFTSCQGVSVVTASSSRGSCPSHLIEVYTFFGTYLVPMHF